MRKSRRALLALTVIALLTGCAASGPQFKQLEAAPAGRAVVYIYRKQVVSRKMDLSPGFVVNNKDVGSLSVDGYLRIVTDTGPTDIRTEKRYLWPAGAPLRALKLNLAAGETRFVEFAVDGYRDEFAGNTRTVYIGVTMREVSEATAMQLLPQLKQQN